MDTFKIIVIIFLIILTYQIYQINCIVYKDIEGFADTPAQSLGGIDDANAINTLAQIAKNLMAGGVTIPGNINVQGVIQSSVDKWNISADGKNRTYYGNNANSYYGSGNGVHNFRTGANGNGPDGMVIDQNNNVTIAGHTIVGVDQWNLSVDGKNRTYYGNNANSYYGSANGVHNFRSGANGNGPDGMVLDQNSNLTVGGTVIAGGRNILAELDQCIKNGNVIFNQRTADGRFVWGDGVGSPDSGWSRWVIRKA